MTQSSEIPNSPLFIIDHLNNEKKETPDTVDNFTIL